jgi:hypothetical protein
MKNIVVLVDANVILDYVTTRDPYYHDAYKIIDMCHSGIVKGYLAFHSISIIWYVLRKYMPDADRRLWLKKILQALHVTGASHELVLKAVDMDYFMDFEDCLQDRCAESVNAQYIITNNVKDFKESVITAITPRDFERLIKQ